MRKKMLFILVSLLISLILVMPAFAVETREFFQCISVSNVTSSEIGSLGYGFNVKAKAPVVIDVLEE